ncbi:hypothetical protein [Noviherbaspirillum sp. 1P10PC]|uniref:hypothetical protein n=1 Tax=Noviherbaspirillum sp. 1P10PC TaxID=3132292 RepID=UPI0039A0A44D
MSRKGDCEDNAPIESWSSSFKNERIHRVRYNTQDAKKPVNFDYIEAFYNRQRQHSEPPNGANHPSKLDYPPGFNARRIAARNTTPLQRNKQLQHMGPLRKRLPVTGDPVIANRPGAAPCAQFPTIEINFLKVIFPL